MKITFEGSTAEVVGAMAEFIARASDLYSAGSEGAPAACDAPAGITVVSAGPGRPVGSKDSAPRTRTRKAKAEPINAETPAATPPAEEKQPALAAAPAISAPAVSAPKLADAQAALAALFEAKGMQDSLKVLARFKVKKVQELNPADFADFIEAATTAVK